MKFKSLFSRKNKKKKNIIKFLFAELAKRVEKVIVAANI